MASLRHEVDDMGVRRCDPPTLWNTIIPNKLLVHSWQVRLDHLPTNENLQKRGIELKNYHCVFCNEQLEAAKHLFLDCRIACKVK